MARPAALCASLLAMVALAGALPEARAEYGDVLLNRHSDRGGVRPVVFPHWFHRIRFRCKVCHHELGFEMRAGANDVRMSDIIEGRFCGMCHNGDIACLWRLSRASSSLIRRMLSSMSFIRASCWFSRKDSLRRSIQMDVLSEVLKAVKLDGAVFFNGELSAPWCTREPDSHTMGSFFPSSPKHVSIFHLVTEGQGYVRLKEGARAVPLQAGDVVILPHGDAHLMGNGPPVTPIDSGLHLKEVFAEGRILSQLGGGGETTKLVCGYLTCELQLSQVLLAGLPTIIKVHIRDSPSGQWIEDTFRYSVDHAEASGPGGAATIAKLSELLFVETLRRYIAQLPQTQTGW